MAFSKAKDGKSRLKDQVREDLLLKRYVYKEQDATEVWRRNWGWILTEYEDYKKKSKEITNRSVFLAEVKQGQEEKIDTRTIKPLPETRNHEYGWIADKKEFSLSFVGEELYHPMPLPDLYELKKPYNM